MVKLGQKKSSAENVGKIYVDEQSEKLTLKLLIYFI